MPEQSLILYILCTLIFMLSLAVALVWFFHHAQKKITAAKINEQELKLEFQKELLLNTVRTKEQERTRIAQELHDGVSSQLGIANLHLHVLKKGATWTDDQYQVLNQIAQSVTMSAERTRTISHELMPLVFSKYGLHHTLNELENAVNLTNTAKFSITDDYLIQITDDFKLLHIYRILQELVNNTLKYAKAKNMDATFSTEGSLISLRYTDDGLGFDTQKVSSGLGFSSINTRVALLDGTIAVQSKSGQGMSATIKFPNHD